jgi:hypothetical protein
MFECAVLVKQLDSVLFPVSLLWDTDHRRRALYGTPGSFRPKTYGLEYRVLSNKWLVDEGLAAWVYDATIWSMRMLGEGTFFGEDDYLQEKLGLARSDPEKFTEDRALHEDMYWYHIGYGVPEFPLETLYPAAA